MRFLAVTLVLSVLSSLAVAQEPAATAPRRALAPGIVTVIPPEPKEEETFYGPKPIPEILAIPKLNFAPNFSPKSSTVYERAQAVTLRRTIWALEFAFKPMRMMEIDIPQPSGKMQRQLIWYMLYRVRNVGNEIRPLATQTEDEFKQVIYSGSERVKVEKIRFFPHFTLEGVSQQVDKSYTRKTYLDRVIPVAAAAISEREKAGRLLNSMEMAQIDIPVDESPDGGVWGYVTWEFVDPRTNFFSIYAKGLTNAYRVIDPPKGQTSVGLAYKTLQLNFWRPSDQFREHEEEIRYGIPAVPNPVEQKQFLAHYLVNERLDYLWVYR